MRRPTRARLVAAALLLLTQLPLGAAAQRSRVTTAELRDRIRGGWAGQTIGVTFGGPYEFKYNGTMIQDYVPLAWNPAALRDAYDHNPGLYDDLYVDLTFVDVCERKGLGARAADFADAFAHAGYDLWHANQAARYNLLHGIAAPASGHWLNNPEADAIDFQIEADFAGLMSPGLPQAAAAIADTVGHIMNYGDGWYGGVFVATMYSLALVSKGVRAQDVRAVVTGALQAIPPRSTFHQTIADVLRWHDQYPTDWKRTWFEIQTKWSEDVGTPIGVFSPFDIDAKLNAAYVVLGLLYGGGDFGRTLEIATRAGQDADCNPSTAGGVLGAMLGYSRIPEAWRRGLADVEARPFAYTTISLNDAYRLSFEHALENVRRHGGRVDGDAVEIPAQPVRPVRLEQSFVGHVPVARLPLDRDLTDTLSFAFDGIGYAVTGATTSNARSSDGTGPALDVAVYVDGARVETVSLPTGMRGRRFNPFFRYQLPRGPHTVRLQALGPTDGMTVRLTSVVVYDDRPRARLGGAARRP